MSGWPRDYTPQDRRKLQLLSGNRCAFPNCDFRITDGKTETFLSNICHIEDANPGWRYNPDMTNAERAWFDNLIILCPNHHILTNDKNNFSVQDLKDMKRNHESKQLESKLTENPSMLGAAVTAISKIKLGKFEESEVSAVFDPNIKITFNSVKRNISRINEYKIYHEKINSLYDELEREGSVKKENLLSTIKIIYIRIKGKYVMDSNTPLDVIRENADNIIEDVYEELYKELHNNGLFREDITIALELIVVDAFIRCKILEEPKDYDNQ